MQRGTGSWNLLEHFTPPLGQRTGVLDKYKLGMTYPLNYKAHGHQEKCYSDSIRNPACADLVYGIFRLFMGHSQTRGEQVF